MRPWALVAIAVVSATATRTPTPGAARLWLRAELSENTAEGPAHRRCDLAAILEGEDRGRWRVFFGEARADGSGGWSAMRTRSGCAPVASEADPGPWVLRGSPYLIADLDLRAASATDGLIRVEGSMTLRKLTGFDAAGAPTYQRSHEDLRVKIPDGGSRVLQLLVADSRERDELHVRELLLHLRADDITAAPRRYGAIAVSSDVPRASILLDGRMAGLTSAEGPVVLPNVPTGQRLVAVRDASGREARTTVRVDEGRQSQATLQFLPPARPGDPPGLRRLGSNPQGGEEFWREKDGAIVVRLRGGDFPMGSAGNEGEAGERPQHTVRLPGFLVDKTEVTWGQLRRFAKETSHPLPKAPVWGTPESFPASNVTWQDARAYCEWVGGRLPSEAEWEYAARGGGASVYPWGDAWNPARCNTRDGGPHAPTAAASYPACVSVDGVLDLPGSVWEWCADWFSAGYYAESPAESPTGPASGELRVSRGGSWISPSTWVRNAYRMGTDPTWADALHGFRCVHDDPAATAVTPPPARTSSAVDTEPRTEVVIETSSGVRSGDPQACAVAQSSGPDRLFAWSTFGAARPAQGGGFDLVAAAQCGKGPFSSGPLPPGGAAPYLIVEVAAAPSLDPAPMDPGPGRTLEVGVSVATRKLASFSAEGAPIYGDPTLDQRRARLTTGDEYVVPIPLREAREREVLGSEVQVQVRAQPFPGGAVSEYGSIRVIGAAPQAEVLLDASRAADAGAGGEALLTNVPPGVHQVGVRGVSGAEARRAVETVGGETAVVSFGPPAAAPALLEAAANARGFAQFRRARDGAFMVEIPAGDFIMGNLDTEGSPLPHTVRLSRFLMDQLAVTWRRYEEFAAASGRPLPPSPYWGIHGDHPVVYVSWDEARAYCEWAGARLPTEAEREKGARGTDGRLFPWGNEEATPDRAVFRRNWGYEGTDTAGIRPEGASPYGLLDVGGNVWEWCDDWYDADYYKTSPGEDPLGPATGRAHVVRGGSWDSRPTVLSASCRNWGFVGYREGDFGFRCAADPPR